MVPNNLAPGTICRVVQSTSAHGTAIGSTVTIRANYGSTGYYINENGSYFSFADLEVVSLPKPLYESLKDQARNLEIQQKILAETAKALESAKVEALSDRELKELKCVVIREMGLDPVDEARYLSKI